MGKGSLLERLGLVRKPPLTVEEFRDRVIAEVVARKSDFDLGPVREDEFEHGEHGIVRVARAYAYYRENPRELNQIVRQLGDLALYEAPAATPEALIVLVRPVVFQGEDGDTELGLARASAWRRACSSMIAIGRTLTFRVSVIWLLRPWSEMKWLSRLSTSPSWFRRFGISWHDGTARTSSVLDCCSGGMARGRISSRPSNGLPLAGSNTSLPRPSLR
jgi:hypothetical protein